MLLSKEQGQGLLEYALIISLVVVIVIVLVYLIGPQVGNMYSDVIEII
ncbi:MAG: pilus assembly protein [Anaerolineaceae bacterium]|nr:pilus assembly protein [Anaerolineaceae bacterium]